MIIHIFSPEKFELIKRRYMDLEARFNMLAGFIKGGVYDGGRQQDPATEGNHETEDRKNYRSDCREGIFCLDYAYFLINRMGCGYGDLTMHISRCHEALKDLEEIVVGYENKALGKKLAEMPRFNRLDDYLNLERSIAIFPKQIEAIRQDIADSGQKPEEVLNGMLDLDPEQIRMILEMLEEDMLIKSRVQATSSQQTESL